MSVGMVKGEIETREFQIELVGDPPEMPIRKTVLSVSFFTYDLPQITEVLFPKERFVIYEPSDARWAVPLGIAKEVTRDMRTGDSFDVTDGKFSLRFNVTRIECRDEGFCVEGIG